MKKGNRLSRKQLVARSKICSTISLLASVITLVVASFQFAVWMGVTITHEMLSDLIVASIASIAAVPMGVALWLLLAEGAKLFFECPSSKVLAEQQAEKLIGEGKADETSKQSSQLTSVAMERPDPPEDPNGELGSLSPMVIAGGNPDDGE